MFPVLATITLTFLFAAFFPQNALIFTGALLSATAALVLLGRRDGMLVAPLSFGAPLIARFLFTQTGFRASILIVAWLLLFWGLSDIRARARGAPLVRERVELFLFSGAFTIFLTAFLSASSLHPSALLLLSGVGVFGAMLVAVLRAVSERARGLSPQAVPISTDAAVSGLLLAEVFVACSFLPLSPFMLAAVMTICAWALAEIVGLARLALLTVKDAFRVSIVAAFVLGAIVVTIPFRAGF